MENATKKIDAQAFALSICWLIVVSVSFKGALNPYPLGLLDSVAVISVVLGSLFLIKQSYLIVLHSFFIAFSVFIVVSSWLYFDYFQSLYTLEILAMKADLGEARKALNLSQYDGRITFLVVSTTILTVIAARAHAPQPSLRKRLGMMLLIAGLAGIVIVEMSLAAYIKRGVPWLHPANLHPLHALVKWDIQKSNSIERKELNVFRSLNKHSEPAIGIKPKPIDKPNILIVLLESFRADMTGYYSGGRSALTPNFDKIAAGGSTAVNYYSNTTHTISAELSIWCGLFDNTGATKFAYQTDISRQQDCLPNLLQERGYQSFYFHGNKGQFYNRDHFIPMLGFNSIYFHQDQPNASIKGVRVGWGIDDESMLKIMLRQLETSSVTKPFFAHITTLSNHYPFHWDFPVEGVNLPYPNTNENDIWENYQNAVFYTDYALGKFWDEFQQSPLSKNTIVVLTSDHGIWRFPERQTMELEFKNESFFRAPFVIVNPIEGQPKKSSAISSHIDVLPTIMNQIGLAQENNEWTGKDIFNPATRSTNSWAIMSKGVDHILRMNDLVCYFDINYCETNQQDCAGWLGEILIKTDQQQFEQCGEITGDLLVGGSIKTVKDDQMLNLFQAARKAMDQSADTFSN